MGCEKQPSAYAPYHYFGASHAVDTAFASSAAEAACGSRAAGAVGVACAAAEASTPAFFSRCVSVAITVAH